MDLRACKFILQFTHGTRGTHATHLYIYRYTIGSSNHQGQLNVFVQIHQHYIITNNAYVTLIRI